MGARQKINELHFLGVAVASVFAGVLFASIDFALLVGVLLSALLIAGGGIRLAPDTPPRRSASRTPHRGRHRR